MLWTWDTPTLSRSSIYGSWIKGRQRPQSTQRRPHVVATPSSAESPRPEARSKSHTSHEYFRKHVYRHDGSKSSILCPCHFSWDFRNVQDVLLYLINLVTLPDLLSVKSLPSGPSFGVQAFPSSHCRGPGLLENSWAACSSVHRCQSLQRCRGSLALGNTSASTDGIKSDQQIMVKGSIQGNQILQEATLFCNGIT